MRRCMGMWTVVQYAALALALVVVVAFVVRRLGPPSPMSWLDAVMGASSVGAVAVPAGPGAAIALGGLAGVLALSRWHLRPQPPQPGPEFSPVVLTAVLTFAAIGLGLLLLGQFVDIS